MMVGIRPCRRRGGFDLECAVSLRSYGSLEDGFPSRRQLGQGSIA